MAAIAGRSLKISSAVSRRGYALSGTTTPGSTKMFLME